jgi:hypothetical protein
VRNWQWNNAWYTCQERPVQNLGLKEVSQHCATLPFCDV